ncbi:response regulator transcription factor [Parafrankia sp. BMG5.11]|uniref:response regulator transcription factor n=1 Tax=Parafrankia sp. BMG5.11 TaxID=222540 RepID=UPI00103E2811|nr:response regulator transcription factor [Parafrankia sp. BMG5.11]TCJ34472.1 response regulator transcription factor [Parafrankia sp. BMG5.11]
MWPTASGGGDGAVASAAPDHGQPSPSLLIADDEANDELLPALRGRGVEVSVVTDGAQALVEIGRLDPSAVLISARLPVVDGVTVIRTVRSVAGRDTTPILFAVGPGDREQAAAALEAGASACVGKPYRLHEVLAMVGAVGGLAAVTAGLDGSGGLSGSGTRMTPAAGRAGSSGGPEGAGGFGGLLTAGGTGRPGSAGVLAVPAASSVLRSGPVVLDVDAHEVTVDGRAVHMPPREFRLLHLLLGHAGRVVTRETLLTEVWGSADTDPNTLAVHVRRLRRRLGDSISGAADGAAAQRHDSADAPGVSRPVVTSRGLIDVHPPLIESIRGIGYRFRAPAPRPT